MKVNAWKNIDVEVEVDVEIEDVLRGLMEAAEEDGMYWRKLSAIDTATKILEKLGTAPLALVESEESKVKAAENIMQRLGPLLAWCRGVIEVST